MKRVIIIGASGSLAKNVTDTLSNLANVQLTLLARDRSRVKCNKCNDS